MKIILLAGGLGTRLWPLTKPPKQFSHFIGKQSLFQKTLLRFLRTYLPKDLVIVTKEAFLSYAQSQAEEIDQRLKMRIIAEPEGKNTAPALLFALQWLKEQKELEECFLITPSDHLMAPESQFMDKVIHAEKIAKEGFHVLFGIFPTHPHPGYGYIKCDPKKEVSHVEGFFEKPSLDKAQTLLDQCLWNTGITVFQTQTFLKDLKTHQPEMIKAFEDNDFASFPTLSIDHALLEFSDKLKVIPLHLSWSDLGTWENVYDHFEKDREHNVKIGKVEAINTKNCLIFSNKRRISTIDVEDLFIVETEEGLLVSKKRSSEKIKKV